MKSWLLVGGPILLATWAGFYTNFFTYGNELPGMVHFSGVPMGGLFQLNTKVYQCDEGGNNCVLVEETNEFAEVADLEFETQDIKYREGTGNDIFKTKQPGLSKYTNIQLKRRGDFEFDYSELKFVPRVDGSIFLLDEQPVSEILPPVEPTLTDPEYKRAQTNEDAMEVVELEVEELELE